MSLRRSTVTGKILRDPDTGELKCDCCDGTPCTQWVRATVCNPVAGGCVFDFEPIYICADYICPQGGSHGGSPPIAVRVGALCYDVDRETLYDELPPGVVAVEDPQCITSCESATCEPLGWVQLSLCPCSPATGHTWWMKCEDLDAAAALTACPVFPAHPGVCVRLEPGGIPVLSVPKGGVIVIPNAATVKRSCCECCSGCSGVTVTPFLWSLTADPPTCSEECVIENLPTLKCCCVPGTQRVNAEWYWETTYPGLGPGGSDCVNWYRRTWTDVGPSGSGGTVTVEYESGCPPVHFGPEVDDMNWEECTLPPIACPPEYDPNGGMSGQCATASGYWGCKRAFYSGVGVPSDGGDTRINTFFFTATLTSSVGGCVNCDEEGE